MAGGDAGLKAIAKRQKQKGLGRLRLYCQMCEKQCRDENGFKCHAATPAHQQNLALFASQPELFVDRFSKQFLSGFVGVLQQRYGSNPVAANTVYQDYIKDKEHVHMNSTQWSTLSEFAKDLGRRGVCRVEERDGALWVTFVDRQAIERKQRAQEIDRLRLDDEERAEHSLARLMRKVSSDELDAARVDEGEANCVTPLTHVDMRLPKASGPAAERRSGHLILESDSAFKSLKTSKVGAGAKVREAVGTRRRPRAAKVSVLDEIMAEDRAREKSLGRLSEPSHVENGVKCNSRGVLENTGDGRSKMTGEAILDDSNGKSAGAEHGEDPGTAPEPWLRAGITVKCVAKALKGGPYYKQKGIVKSLRDRYTAVVLLKESGAALELDQDDLETVLPKPGGQIVFVRGHLEGRRGILDSIEEGSFSASVRLDPTSPIVSGIDYDTICKWTSA